MNKKKFRAWRQLEFGSLDFQILTIKEDKSMMGADLKIIEKNLNKLNKMIKKGRYKKCKANCVI